MTLVEWLLVGVIAIGALNFIAISVIAVFVWNIDSNAADTTKLVGTLSHHAAIAKAAERIEQAIRR